MVFLLSPANYNFAANPKSPIFTYILSLSIIFPSLRLYIVIITLDVSPSADGYKPNPARAAANNTAPITHRFFSSSLSSHLEYDYCITP